MSFIYLFAVKTFFFSWRCLCFVFYLHIMSCQRKMCNKYSSNVVVVTLNELSLCRSAWWTRRAGLQNLLEQNCRINLWWMKAMLQVREMVQKADVRQCDVKWICMIVIITNVMCVGSNFSAAGGGCGGEGGGLCPQLPVWLEDQTASRDPSQ